MFFFLENSLFLLISEFFKYSKSLNSKIHCFIENMKIFAKKIIRVYN